MKHPDIIKIIMIPRMIQVPDSHGTDKFSVAIQNFTFLHFYYLYSWPARQMHPNNDLPADKVAKP